MGIAVIMPALRLSRLPSCTVAFLTAFVPTYTHTLDLSRSFALSIPVFTICICAFIINDLNDVERDRVNHPSRPLPSGQMPHSTAAIIYLTTFATSLLTIKLFAEPSLHYLYLAVFLLATNYSLVVDFIPKLKTIYVASTITLALALVAQMTDSRFGIHLLAAAFFFILGRELLMDVRDLSGDGDTLAKWLSAKRATFLAFGLQAISLIMLVFGATTALEAASVLIIGGLLLVAIRGWRTENHREHILKVMQVQMLVGITFLI